MSLIYIYIYVHIDTVIKLNYSTDINPKMFARTATRFRQYQKPLLFCSLIAGSALSTSTIVRNDSNKLILTPEEVSKHNKPDDLWIVLSGQVYNLTEFLPNHPGGQKILLKNAGKDATKIFVPIHAPDVLDKFIPKENHLGPLVGEFPEVEEELTEEEEQRLDYIERKPPLSQILNINDFEYVAKKILTPGALAYYSSAADDEVSMRENHNAYHRIFFKPKVLVDVREVDCSTEFFGHKSDVPFYVSAAALAKLGNPNGEVDIAKGAGKENCVQMISTLASCSFDEIVDAAIPGQNQWLQLYVNGDRAVTDKFVKHAEERGMKGLFITVDAPSLGRRERDMKVKFEGEASNQDDDNLDRSQGASKALSTFIDPSLNWKDIDHFKKLTKMPIIIKGVQRVEDVLLAAEHGVQGVVLSNHGGRQIDYSRAPIEVLAEVMPILREKGLDKNFDIFIDGGVKRGTDVLKALCLGAKGVGLGRPFLYANSAYGANGVQRAIQLLRDEVEMNMRLLGVNKLEELGPHLVDTRCLYNRTVNVPTDNLYENNYQHLQFVDFKPETD